MLPEEPTWSPLLMGFMLVSSLDQPVPFARIDRLMNLMLFTLVPATFVMALFGLLKFLAGYVNLLTNAIQAMDVTGILDVTLSTEEGSVQAWVRISAGRFWMLRVEA